jgi:predicted amidohydrolase YtcJ
MTGASLVLIGIQGSPLDPTLFALEVRDGRIHRTWSKQEWSVSPAEEGRIVDVDGACVLPGIDDSHLHGYEYGRALTAVDLRFESCPSLGALQDAVRRAPLEPNGWVRGIGWDDSRISGSGPDGQLCAADIDVARADVPVLLSDVTGHQAVGNSLALRLAGLDHGGVEDPVGGQVVRDAHGHPTGLLREAAVSLVNGVIPPVGIAEKRDAIIAAQRSLLAQGVTAYTDPGLGPGAATLMDGTADLDAVQAYRDLDSSGELRLRVDLMLLYGGLGGTTAQALTSGLDTWGPPERMLAHGHLGVSQVKVFADGIPRSRTAWMSEPYDDCTHGHLTVAGSTDDERVAEMRSIVLAAAERGWQVGVHTTGDRATQVVVDAFVDQPTDAMRQRHYIIHGDFAPEPTLRRMAEHRITLNSNPSIRWMVGEGVNRIIGAERNARRQPLRTAWDLGVNVCSSSDAPVSPPDWRVMVAAAMTRSIRSDSARTDAQRLTGREALLSLTANAAWQGHAEDWRGRIAPGYAADLVVLDSAVDWSDPWSLTERGIRATMISGQVCHGSL